MIKKQSDSGKNRMTWYIYIYIYMYVYTHMMFIDVQCGRNLLSNLAHFLTLHTSSALCRYARLRCEDKNWSLSGHLMESSHGIPSSPSAMDHHKVPCHQTLGSYNASSELIQLFSSDFLWHIGQWEHQHEEYLLMIKPGFINLASLIWDSPEILIVC